MSGTNNPSGIEPLEFNVLVKPQQIEQKTKGGLYLPDDQHEREQWAQVKATVVAVAPDAFEAFEGGAAVGDTIIFAKHSGMTVTGLDGEEYRIVKDKDVIARVISHD